MFLRRTQLIASPSPPHPGFLTLRLCRLALVLLPLIPLTVALPVRSASPLLERVKQNPRLARSMCKDFRVLNKEGISAMSAQGLDRVASSQGLNRVDAEVLTTYVIGIHCPEVR